MAFQVRDPGLSSCTISFDSHVQPYEVDVLQREKLKLSDGECHATSEWQRNLNSNLSYSKALKHHAVLALRKFSCYQDIKKGSEREEGDEVSYTGLQKQCWH